MLNMSYQLQFGCPLFGFSELLLDLLMLCDEARHISSTQQSMSLSHWFKLCYYKVKLVN